MDAEVLTVFPCALDDRGRDNILDRLHHVELAQAVADRVLVRNVGKLVLIADVRVLDVSEPVVDQAELCVSKGSLETRKQQ